VKTVLSNIPLQENRPTHQTLKIAAKAADVQSRSDAIVVSFGSEWYDGLKDRKFSAVIRKRIPTSFMPRWLYFHINSPKSAICARAEILSMGEINNAQATRMTRTLDLSTDRIQAYLKSARTIGCYTLGKMHSGFKRNDH
jgi:hypothetical protein